MGKKDKKSIPDPSPPISTPKKEEKRLKQKKDKKKSKKKSIRSRQKNKRSSEEVELPKDNIPINSTIETSSARYLIINKLGSGGFGDVYEAVRHRDKQIFAVKVEYVQKVEDRRLKKEYEIYREITRAKMRAQSNTDHLMQVIDYGECSEIIHFMFLPLCGQALDALLTRRIPALETAIILSDQTLRAIQNFHSFGHIHRDIKPANFVLGRAPNDNSVYLIDFGMAVRYCTSAEKMPKTSSYDFIGTLRYASRTTHLGNVQTRKDDLESWLFLVAEFYKYKILPWANENDAKLVEILKKRFFNEQPSEVFSLLPPCFSGIVKTIEQIKPLDTPNYESIRRSLLAFAETNRFAMDAQMKYENGEFFVPRVTVPRITISATQVCSTPASPTTNITPDYGRNNGAKSQMTSIGTTYESDQSEVSQYMTGVEMSAKSSTPSQNVEDDSSSTKGENKRLYIKSTYFPIL